MIAEEIGLGKSSVHTILREHLDMKMVCAKIVPKLLTPDEKLRRKFCADWKTSDESDKFFERVITGDEWWFYDYDLVLKLQSSGNTKNSRDRNNHGKVNKN
jgi:hypothetical protein